MDSDITELRVCPDCAREDIAAYGRPYLHTVHHLPGARMCPKHHRVLMRVQIEPDDWERGLDDGSMVPVELRADEQRNSVSVSLCGNYMSARRIWI